MRRAHPVPAPARKFGSVKGRAESRTRSTNRPAFAGLEKWIPWTGRRIVELLIIGLIVEYLLLPQLAGTHHWLHLIATVNWWWVAAGLGFELASLVAFTLATRVLLPDDGSRPGLLRLWQMDLASIALSHAVPGGAAAGTALGYRLLHRSGVDPGAATFAKLGQGAISALVLQAFLLSSVAIAIPLHGNSPLYLTACVSGGALVLALAGLTIGLLRYEAGVARAAAAITARLPKLSAESGSRLVERIAAEIRAIAHRPKVFAVAAAWSAGNWVFDALALWCSVAAFGHYLGYDGLLVPFCLANTAAWIPLTPSGLGIVEGVIVPVLVGFSTPPGIALLGTTTWRLLNFWLPIPMGAVAYLALPRRAREPAAQADRGSPAVEPGQ
jgi:uncharacterized protein (TIRG00374 family)